MDLEASNAFCNGHDYTRGAQHARKAGAFDRALEIIHKYSVEKAVAYKITEVCKVVYVRGKDYRLVFPEVNFEPADIQL